jgi:hypothetical protein
MIKEDQTPDLKLLTYQQPEIEKLEFVDSIHEQRETNSHVIPCTGAWLELGKWTPIIETWDIHERWKCTETTFDETKKTLTCKLKKLNYDAMRKESEAQADIIMELYGQEMIQSFKMQLIRGIYNKRMWLEDLAIRVNNHGDKEKIKQKLSELNTQQYLEYKKALLAKIQEQIKKAEEKIIKGETSG